MQSYYPERLGKLYLVHAPIIFWSAWKLAVPFIHPVTKEKVTLQLRHVRTSRSSRTGYSFSKIQAKATLPVVVESNNLIHIARSFGNLFNSSIAHRRLSSSTGEKFQTLCRRISTKKRCLQCTVAWKRWCPWKTELPTGNQLEPLLKVFLVTGKLSNLQGYFWSQLSGSPCCWKVGLSSEGFQFCTEQKNPGLSTIGGSNK